MPFKFVGYNKVIDTASPDATKQSMLDLVQWTSYEFQGVASAMQGTEPDQIWNSAPPKPRRGTYAYADGTHWNPGSGEGPYTFDGTNWNPMTNQAAPVIIPSGSVMIFWQTAAPTGWTKLTTQNDKALRVVSGSGGVSGGTNAFSTVMAQTTTGNHQLVLSEIPSHTHTEGTVTFPGSGSPFQVGTGLSVTGVVQASGSAGGDGVHSHPLTMAMQYIDVIIASKN